MALLVSIVSLLIGNIRPKALVEQLVVVEQRAVGFWSDGLVATSLYHEIVTCLVVLIVAQNEGQMVGTLFVERHDATMNVSLEYGQAHAWFTIGFHIPDAILAPMVVVAPFVDLSLTTDGDAVNIAAEHLATIDQQLHVADAVVMIHILGIVVGPQGKAYPARFLSSGWPNPKVCLSWLPLNTPSPCIGIAMKE